MEIGERAMGAVQTKLTQVFRVEKQTPEKVKGGRQGEGLCRLGNSELVTREAMDWCESENVVGEREASSVVQSPEAASFLVRASNMMRFSPRGVQSGYNSFPGMEFGARAFEIQKPGGVSLQPVKVEQVLSPGSCVTNDSVFHDASGAFDGEVLSTVHVDAEPCGKESVAQTEVRSGIEGDSLQASKQVAVVPVSPVKNLMTALAMIPNDSIVGQTKKLLTPASSDSSTLEMSMAVMVTVGSLPSAQKVLGSVKVEAVESKDKLITAMDMFEGGPSSETETHVQSRKVDAPPPDATPKKLMTALHIFPSEAQKREAMEHSQMDVGCEEMSLAPTTKANKSAAAHHFNLSVVLHVKSEPVDNSGGLEDGGPLKELERVALQNEMSQILRNAVKQELLNSTPEYQGRVLTVREEPQASQKPSEDGHSSPDCADAEEMEDELLPTQVHNGADDRMLSCRSQNREKEQESQRDKEIKNRKSNPGRRIQSGRIYDSSLGKTCHWCRQKTVEHHVKCRECTINYCGPCLMNRNGENVLEELAEGVRWLCPKCRSGCGPGCVNCCNCGPCRKAGGKVPTGQLVSQARKVGFSNAHDYLVHLETGESPEEVAQRKVGRDWTNCGRFEWKDTLENSEVHDEPLSSGGTDEFTLNEETSTQLHEGKICMKVLKRFVESQKPKRGATRAPLLTKRSQVEASPSVSHRDVDNILAKLEVPGERFSKGKENEVQPATRRVEQKFKDDTALTPIQEDLDIRNNNSGMRICKREYVEVNAGNNVGGLDGEDTAVAKRIKLEGYNGEQRHAPLSEIRPSWSSLLGPFSRVKCKAEPTTLSEDNLTIFGVDVSNEAGPRRKYTSDADTPGGQAWPSNDSVLEGALISKMRRPSVLNGARTGLNSGANQLMFEQRGLECPGDPQGTEYRTKLKSALAQPFDAKELEILEESAKCRKPVQKLRQMRGRIVDVITKDEGFSYLDHHQDFASKLEEAQSPPLKLALLRGFFFWLQHSCMEGAFRPWPGALAESRSQSGDCIETDGPDCQVTAVVLQLDEGKDALQPNESNEAHRRLKRKFTKMEERPLAITDGVCKPDLTSNRFGGSTSRQALIPFQARKNPVHHVKLPKMKGTILAGTNYRVVLCLPAPALRKI